jgi:hypothetical protein
MTEQEAKTKWCPFALSRVIPWVVEGGIKNKIFAGPTAPEPMPLCVGSACMAWREIVKDREAPSPAPLGVREKYSAGGYCGLAGKP